MYDNRQQQCYPSNTSFATEERLSTFGICPSDIVKIIRSLDPNKAHGHDEITIRMIKICASPIAKTTGRSL